MNEKLNLYHSHREAFKAIANSVASALRAELGLSVGDDGPEDSIRATFARGNARVQAFFSPTTNEVWFDKTGYGRGRGSRYTKVERLEENVGRRLKLAEERAASQAAYDARRKEEDAAQAVVDGWRQGIAAGLLAAREATGAAQIHPVISTTGEQTFRIDVRYIRGRFRMEAQVAYSVDAVAGFFDVAIAADAKING